MTAAELESTVFELSKLVPDSENAAELEDSKVEVATASELE